MSHNQIQDIYYIEYLRKLQELNISHNQIYDITQLKHLRKLTSLDLSFNQIIDISALQTQKFQVLLLNNNRIVHCKNTVMYKRLKIHLINLLNQNVQVNINFENNYIIDAQNQQIPDASQIKISNNLRTIYNIQCIFERYIKRQSKFLLNGNVYLNKSQSIMRAVYQTEDRLENKLAQIFQDQYLFTSDSQ
ncbi:Conserved_hypothetical protein [Hexamita inflata]|uniref:Leucine-rich repeat protein n=2 Tax=Hexamita inflata TaxID=28002 RepID=A0AA86RVT2_9EUKA|nr:Conserved hypothetical protein [Hexamita inflata]